MDGQRFDDLTKRIGGGRRGFLKMAVGVGGSVAVARLGVSDTKAARRGYGGPVTGQTPESVSISFARGDSGCRPVFTVAGFAANSTQYVYWYFFTPTGGSGGPYLVSVTTNASGTGSTTGPLDLGRGFTVTASVESSRAEAGPTIVAC